MVSPAHSFLPAARLPWKKPPPTALASEICETPLAEGAGHLHVFCLEEEENEELAN